VQTERLVTPPAENAGGVLLLPVSFNPSRFKDKNAQQFSAAATFARLVRRAAL
jgi:hypothetical protein